MIEVTLLLSRGEQAEPFMKLQCPEGRVQGLLSAVLSFSAYVPLKVVIDGNVITAFDLVKDGMVLRGHPAEWVGRS